MTHRALIRFLPTIHAFAGVLTALAAAATVRAQGGPSMVEVAVVKQRTVAPTIELVGTVRPNRRATLSTEVAGMVIEIPVDAGDHVKAGAVVCRLSEDVRRFELSAAQGELNRLAQVLAEWEAGERPEDLDRLKAAHEEAQAELSRWEFEKDRIEGLRKRGQSTDKELQDATWDYNAAVSRLRQAEAAWRKGQAGARVETVRAAQYAHAGQQSVVDRLAYELEQTRIKAPFSGAITAKLTEVGQWVSEGEEVVELLELDPVRIRVNVPERAVDFARSGAPATIRIDALGAEPMHGRIARVIPDADVQARTFPLDIDLPNPQGRIKPGMFARAAVPAAEGDERLVVPKDAVLLREGGPVMFVVRMSDGGAMAEPVAVDIVADFGDETAVNCKTVKAGDQVVVRGNERMMGPSPIIPPGPPPSTAPVASEASGAASSQPEPRNPSPETRS